MSKKDKKSDRSWFVRQLDQYAYNAASKYLEDAKAVMRHESWPEDVIDLLVSSEAASAIAVDIQNKFGDLVLEAVEITDGKKEL